MGCIAAPFCGKSFSRAMMGNGGREVGKSQIKLCQLLFTKMMSAHFV